MDVSTVGPDGRHHGRPRRRHRLRAAAGHPLRRVPAGRPRQAIEAAAAPIATAGRSVVFAAATVLVSLMGLRAGRPADVRVLRLRHRDRRDRRAATAITLVPALCGLAGRRLLPRRVRKAARARRAAPVTRALGHPRRASDPLAWALASLRRAADAGRTRPGDADVAAGRLGPAAGAHHPQGLRPGGRRVRSGRQRPVHLRRRRRTGSAAPSVAALAAEVAARDGIVAVSARSRRRMARSRSSTPQPPYGPHRRAHARPGRPTCATTC